MTLLLLILSLSLQDTATIKKAHKGPYMDAVKDYEKAVRAFKEGSLSEAI
jgi:hypothetical protein